MQLMIYRQSYIARAAHSFYTPEHSHATTQFVQRHQPERHTILAIRNEDERLFQYIPLRLERKHVDVRSAKPLIAGDSARLGLVG